MAKRYEAVDFMALFWLERLKPFSMQHGRLKTLRRHMGHLSVAVGILKSLPSGLIASFSIFQLTMQKTHRLRFLKLEIFG